MPKALAAWLLAAGLCLGLCGCDNADAPPSDGKTSTGAGTESLRIVSVQGRRVGKDAGNRPMLEVRAEIENTGAAPVELYILRGDGMMFGTTAADEMQIRFRKEENPGFRVPFGLGLEQAYSDDDEFRAAATVWVPEGEPPKPVVTMLTEQVVLSAGQKRVFHARVLAPEATFGAKRFRVFLLDRERSRIDEMNVGL